MTGIWWAHVRDARPALAALLPPSDVARMQRYHQAADRDRHLVAWALSRVIIGDLLGCAPAAVPVSRYCPQCGQSGHGKPYIGAAGTQTGAAGPHFSLSHAGDRVVVAVSSDGPAGVDVEATTRAADAIDGLVRAPAEQPARGADLLRRWVRKEAVLKATGHGLAMPMTRFAVAPPGAPARLLSWPDDPSLPGRLTLRDLASPPGYAAALAVIGPLGQLVTHDGAAVLAALRDGPAVTAR